MHTHILLFTPSYEKGSSRLMHQEERPVCRNEMDRKGRYVCVCVCVCV